MRAAGLPRPSATARTALPEPHKPRGGAGIPAGLPRTPRAPNAAPGGRERSELPRRAARSRPGAARAPLPLRSVLKHPFPERDSRAEPRIPPAHLGRERGSVPRLRPAAPPPPLAPPDRTGPRCPSRGRPSGPVGSGPSLRRDYPLPEPHGTTPTPCTAALGFLIPAVPLQIALRIFLSPHLSVFFPLPGVCALPPSSCTSVIPQG